MSAFHLERDVVGKEAADQRSDRRHQEHGSHDDPEASRNRNNPNQDRDRCGRADTEHVLRPIRAGACKPDQQVMKRNGEKHDHCERKACGFQQHPPERRREHLGECFGGRVDHRLHPFFRLRRAGAAAGTAFVIGILS
jgi:hypothetical protein